MQVFCITPALAGESFSEDPLRMMHCGSFSARLIAEVAEVSSDARDGWPCEIISAVSVYVMSW